MTTAVQDRLVLDRDSEVKPYLGVPAADSAQDWLLDLLLSAGKKRADSFLNNPFTDDAGVDEDIPDDVKLGVLRWIKTEFDGKGVAGNVVARRAGDLSERYTTSVTGGMDTDKEVKRLWQPYRLLPGL